MFKIILILGVLLSPIAQATTAFYDVLIKGAIPEYSIHLGLNDSFTIGHLKKTIHNHEQIDPHQQKIYRAGSTEELADHITVGPHDHNSHSLIVVVGE